jgi:small subunit ribosomal protein S3
MGQKTHPIGFRIGITKDWTSKWYADKREYTKLLHQDIKIKEYIKKRYYAAGVSKVIIERAAERIRIRILCGKTGDHNRP